MKTGTSEAIAPKSFSLRIADFDAQRGADNTEYVQFHTPPSNIIPGNALTHTKLSNGEEKVESTGEGTIRDNPTRNRTSNCEATPADPYKCMTEHQKERSVEVLYQDRAGWEMTFGAVGSARTDRALQIYGKICEDPPMTCKCPCTEVVYWNLCDKIADVTSNLNGIGPNTSKPHEFRVPEVGKVCGEKVDLRVTVVDGDTSGAPGATTKEYDSWRVQKRRNGEGAYVSKTEPRINGKINGNGKTTTTWGEGESPCWIVVPWRAKTQTRFRWSFVKTGTDEIAIPESFNVRLADFDGETRSEVDFESVVLNTAASTVNRGDDVTQSKLPGGELKFTSTFWGNVKDNPTRRAESNCEPTTVDPYQCMTDDQKRKSVEAKYENLGAWEMTFASEGTPNPDQDRAIQIYGQICES